jgi:hypothetical protein
MNPIRACGFDAMDFVTESREIGGENGWGDDDWHLSVGALNRWSGETICAKELSASTLNASAF